MNENKKSLVSRVVKELPNITIMALVSIFIASIITYIDFIIEPAAQFFSYWRVYLVNFFFSLFSLLIFSHYINLLYYLPRWAVPEIIARSRFKLMFNQTVNIIMILCCTFAVKYLLIILTGLYYVNIITTLISSVLLMSIGPILLLFVALIVFKVFTVCSHYKNNLPALFGTSLMLFSTSNSHCSELDNSYSYLSANTVESEHYEIIKIHPGVINHELLYDNINKTFLVQSGYAVTDDYLKINQLGYVIDTFSFDSRLNISGLFFDEYGVVDWAISGNKSLQKFSSVINADEISEADFKGYLSRAEQLDFSKNYDNEVLRCYIKVDDKWIVLESKKRFDDFEQDYDAEYFQLTSKLYLKNINTNKRLQFLKNKIRPFHKWKDDSNAIVIKDFLKQGYKRARLYDINNTDWAGNYGIGYYDVHHQGEKLHFKAFTTQGSDVNYSPGLSLYTAPVKQQQSVKIQLLVLEPHKGKRKSEEIGLYAIRRKISTSSDAIEKFEQQGISFGLYLFSKSKFNWTILFYGFSQLNEKPIRLHNITFKDGSTEVVNATVTGKLDSKNRLMPKELRFELLGVKTKKDQFYLNFNGTIYNWEGPNKGVDINFSFSQTELLEVFQHSLTNSDGVTNLSQELILQVKLTPVDDNHAYISLHLNNEQQSRILKQVSISRLNKLSNSNKEQAIQFFESTKILSLFESAMSDSVDSRFVDEFINQTAVIARESNYIDDYSFQLADHTTKLMIHLSKKRKPKLAMSILKHYMNTLLPEAGRDNKTDDVASNGMVLCITENDDSLCNNIFDTLLPDLNIDNLKNEVLLFNLACYYSLNKKKKEMLRAIKQALLRGKKTSQFNTDTDFKFYWDDPDFLSVIQSVNSIDGTDIQLKK